MWTIGICTDGITNKEYFNDIIVSIRKNNIPDCEIIFCSENRNFTIDHDDVKLLHIPNSKEGWITKKKNEIAKIAKYDNILLIHDYYVLDDNFFKSFKDFGYEWDVCSVRVVDPRGVRIMDWATIDQPYGHRCVHYGDTSKKMNSCQYVSGAVFCVKKQFLLDNPLDESKCTWQGEDLEWSRRCRDKWNIKLNIGTTVSSKKVKEGFERFSKDL